MKQPFIFIFLGFTLVTLTCCSKKQYSRIDFKDVDLRGDELLLFVDCASGFKEWTYGMSHKSGVTITQHLFLVLKYDLNQTTETPLKAYAIQYVMSSDEFDGRYKFRPLGKTDYLVIKRLSNGESTISRYREGIQSGKEIHANDKDRLFGHSPFVYNGSDSFFMVNTTSPKIVNSESFETATNVPLQHVLAKADATNYSEAENAILSEDLKFLIFRPGKEGDGQVLALGSDGQVLTYYIPAEEQGALKEVGFVSNRLAWLCQRIGTSVGTFDGSVRYQTAASGFPKWEYEQGRVLLQPYSFNCYDASGFGSRWVLWNYTNGHSHSISFDYLDFKSKTESALREIRTHRSL